MTRSNSCSRSSWSLSFGKLSGSVLLFLLSTGSILSQQVIQLQPAVSRQVGETVKLDCLYDTKLGYYVLYWYKRLPGGELVFLIYQRSDVETNATQGQYSVNFQKADKTIQLIMSPPQPEDFATYFCCLREPTMKQMIEDLYKKTKTQPEVVTYPYILRED